MSSFGGNSGALLERDAPRPSLAELPPPPAGKTGWPWTEECPPLPALMPTGRVWPRVSIVTPSLNQGAFLEATIRSILLQGYPNLEYLIVDGGSTDSSIDVIRKYHTWLAYWHSTPDNGQSEAINRGFSRATGEIFGWLNSDDVYEPDALHQIVTNFEARQQCLLLYGRGSYIDVEGNRTGPCSWVHPFKRESLLTVNFILQPAAFWRRSLWERVGNLDESHHWAMDWEWFIRATAITEPQFIHADLARFRLTPGSKTMYLGKDKRREIAEICRTHGGVLQPTYLAYVLQNLADHSSQSMVGLPLSWILSRLLRLLRRSIWRNRCLL